MKLYQALKKKKQIIGEISKLKHQITENNTVIKGNSRDYDVKPLFAKLEEKLTELVNLKSAIQKANTSVYDKIFRLSELKSFVDFLKGVPAKSGVHMERYQEVAKEYVCEFDKKSIDTLIGDYEKEISNIQEELEQFNYKKVITI